jgi:hypothetical protein
LGGWLSGLHGAGRRAFHPAAPVGDGVTAGSLGASHGRRLHGGHQARAGGGRLHGEHGPARGDRARGRDGGQGLPVEAAAQQGEGAEGQGGEPGVAAGVPLAPPRGELVGRVVVILRGPAEQPGQGVPQQPVLRREPVDLPGVLAELLGEGAELSAVGT